MINVTPVLAHRKGPHPGQLTPELGPTRCAQGDHLHLGGLSLQQRLVEQLVELVLVLGGVHHSVCQVLKAQPPARVGERGIVGLRASAPGGGGREGRGASWGKRVVRGGEQKESHSGGLGPPL